MFFLLSSEAGDFKTRRFERFIQSKLSKRLKNERKKEVFFLVGNKFAVYLHPLSKTLVRSSRG